jgi:hypothetical protein
MAMIARASTDSPLVDARLCAVVVLANPASTQFTRWVVAALTGIALRARPTASPGEWLLVGACAKAIEIDSYSQGQAAYPRSVLKWLITFAFAWGLISAAYAQRLIDRFRLWRS